MRFVYFVMAEAASVTGQDKVNALGMGVRKFLAPTFPTLLNAVVLAQVEADVSELGKHPVKFTLRGPGRKRLRVLAEGETELEERAGFDLRRPLTLGFQLSLANLPVEEPGAYRLTARIGKATASYVFVVDPIDSAGDMAESA